jgi:hypothetical protein
VVNLLTLLCEPRPCFRLIIAIDHKPKAFDLQFKLSRAVPLKWRPEIVMSGQKIIIMKMEHPKFIDGIRFLPFPFRKLSSAFGLTSAKVWYTYYFNSQASLDYVGLIPDPSYYGMMNRAPKSERRFSSCTTVSGLCYSIINVYWRPTVSITSLCIDKRAECSDAKF